MSLTDSLRGYWKLNAAGLLVDATGLNPNLTNNNGVTSVAGKVGEAAGFDGVNQYLSTPSSANLQAGDIDFTVGGWFWLNSALGDFGLVAKEADVVTRDYRLDGGGGGGFRFIVFGASGGVVGIIQSATVVTTGVWYFIMAWHDSVANTVSIQVNNGTVESAATTGAAGTSAAAFQIGDYGGVGGKGWPGRIDEILFAKRVYTAAERTQLWNNGNGRTFPFTQGAGSLMLTHVGA